MSDVSIMDEEKKIVLNFDSILKTVSRMKHKHNKAKKKILKNKKINTFLNTNLPFSNRNKETKNSKIKQQNTCNHEVHRKIFLERNYVWNMFKDLKFNFSSEFDKSSTKNKVILNKNLKRVNAHTTLFDGVSYLQSSHSELEQIDNKNQNEKIVKIEDINTKIYNNNKFGELIDLDHFPNCLHKSRSTEGN